MNKDNGGPAFPMPFKHAELDHSCEGMTLRDYTAIHATDADVQAHAVYKTVDEVTTSGGLRRVNRTRVLDRAASRYAYADASTANPLSGTPARRPGSK